MEYDEAEAGGTAWEPARVDSTTAGTPPFAHSVRKSSTLGAGVFYSSFSDTCSE